MKDECKAKQNEQDSDEWGHAKLQRNKQSKHHTRLKIINQGEMMKLTLKQIGNRIQEFFSEGIEVVARETKFVQRSSKLTGSKFVQALVFTLLEKPEMSLSSLQQSCLDLDVSISEQGIDDRLDDKSVNFLKQLFSQAVKRFALAQPLAIPLLEQFKAIYLLDSTQISLPETLATLFPGAGGNASPASLKIQLVFDFLCGQIKQTEFCTGREPDQGYRGHESLIASGVLLIMDLGYFVLDIFKKINDADGYFLSRFQSQTALLTVTGERLTLKKLLAEQTTNIAEAKVLIGNRKQHRIPCRLIMLRLPQEVADRQRQKAKDNARRQGRQVSQEYLKLLDWALFITNAPHAMLHTEHVASLYRVRWQIELVFKLCKSFCGLDYIASFRSERILTELYARLIGLVLTYFLIAPFRLPDGATANREISAVKARQIFQRFARFFLLALNHSGDLAAYISDFFRHIARSGFKQKRQKSPNLLHSLSLLSACYDWDQDDFSDDFLLDF